MYSSSRPWKHQRNPLLPLHVKNKEFHKLSITNHIHTASHHLDPILLFSYNGQSHSFTVNPLGSVLMIFPHPLNARDGRSLHGYHLPGVELSAVVAAVLLPECTVLVDCMHPIVQSLSLTLSLSILPWPSRYCVNSIGWITTWTEERLVEANPIIIIIQNVAVLYPVLYQILFYLVTLLLLLVVISVLQWDRFRFLALNTNVTPLKGEKFWWA